MIRWREAQVLRLRRQWRGAGEYDVRLASAEPFSDADGQVRALAYDDVVGPLAPGQRVLLNVNALAGGLGTGGMAMVVARCDPPTDPAPAPGHIVKARYTPVQQVVLTAEEQDSPHHARLAEADDLTGVPVVAADLHSALPAVIAGIRSVREQLRVAYLMTDGAALPIALSRTVAALVEAGWISTTITAGQAYGADLEAVTVHSGLLTATLVAAADVVVVAQGPGNVGTGTRWGFSGVQIGEALNAAHVLRGHPIAVVRASGGDQRGRHQGVSHHSRTVLGRVVLGDADVPYPDDDADLAAQVREVCATASGRLTPVEVETDRLAQALRDCPVPLSTMGRSLSQDARPFLSAAVAGRHAARLACLR